jgi:hypothetical protein
MLGAAVRVVAALGGDLGTFEGNGLMIAMLKAPNLLFELAVVLLVYAIVRRAGAVWAVLAAGAVYLNPGLLVVTAWWGQNDATYTVFIVLTAWLLAGPRPRWLPAWIAYGLAWLAKFQSIVFFPVMAVSSWRRFGAARTVFGGVVGALLVAGTVLPFVAASGQRALIPFVGTVNLFPYITNGAYNGWFWLTGASPVVLRDNLPLVAGLTYQQVGLGLLAVGTLLVCVRAWLALAPDDESGALADPFLTFAAANLTFYMLATQVQARYLYPGLVCLAVVAALRRDWRIGAVYFGLSLAFTHNVFDIVWLGTGLLYYPSLVFFWPPALTAMLTTALYIAFIVGYLRPLWARRVRAAFARTQTETAP